MIEGLEWCWVVRRAKMNNVSIRLVQASLFFIYILQGKWGILSGVYYFCNYIKEEFLDLGNFPSISSHFYVAKYLHSKVLLPVYFVVHYTFSVLGQL